MSEIPAEVGKYHVIRRLGRGGTAEAFLAELRGTAGFTKQLVLKILYPDLAADEAFVKMLVDEARITARLIHANICQVLDLGLEPGVHYLAMEYVPGTDVLTLLKACHRRSVQIPLEMACYIMAEVLGALHYAHEMTDDEGQPLHIVHRDVSPQNILISHHGEVKLTDFGIAKARQRLTRTQAGVIKGKMIYMAPEQASGRPLDRRADVFSAGIVLHELLRGRTFATASDSNVVLQMRKAGMGVESVREHRPEIPLGLEAVVQRALQPDPGDRFPTAEEFRAALVDFLFRRPRPFGRSELSAFLREIQTGQAPGQRAGEAPGAAGDLPGKAGRADDLHERPTRASDLHDRPTRASDSHPVGLYGDDPDLGAPHERPTRDTERQPLRLPDLEVSEPTLPGSRPEATMRTSAPAPLEAVPTLQEDMSAILGEAFKGQLDEEPEPGSDDTQVTPLEGADDDETVDEELLFPPDEDATKVDEPTGE